MREPPGPYRLPWTDRDDPGPSVEVTARCDLSCPGCPRNRTAGGRAFDEVRDDIRGLRSRTGCEAIVISGGEPLLYPRIVETVEFIARQGLKPILLTRGARLTRPLAAKLIHAGLAEFRFHIDSGQRRPDWTGTSESDMNALRERFANLLWDLGGARCGFVVVVERHNLAQVPDVLAWSRARMHKVHNLTLIAPHGPVGKGVTPAEIVGALVGRYPDLEPSACLGFDAPSALHGALFAVPIGGRGRVYGALGAKTLEVAQVVRHLLKGRYGLPTGTPAVGRRTFLLAAFDDTLRRALGNYARSVARDPLRLFEPVYAQPVILGQPASLSSCLVL